MAARGVPRAQGSGADMIPGGDHGFMKITNSRFCVFDDMIRRQYAGRDGLVWVGPGSLSFSRVRLSLAFGQRCSLGFRPVSGSVFLFVGNSTL